MSIHHYPQTVHVCLVWMYQEVCYSNKKEEWDNSESPHLVYLIVRGVICVECKLFGKIVTYSALPKVGTVS